MDDKFDFHNCGNDDALSFGNAMLKVEKLKETVNNVLPEYELGRTLDHLLSQQQLNIDVGLTTDSKSSSRASGPGNGTSGAGGSRDSASK